VKQEIEKTVEQVAFPSAAFRMWRDSGALQVLVPIIGGATDTDLAAIDKIRRPGDTSNLARQSSRKQARISALFAPAANGRVADALKQLRFSNAEVRWIASVIAAWRELASEMRSALAGSEAPEDAAFRRWAAIAGRTRLASVLRLAAARWAAERDTGAPVPTVKQILSSYRRALRIAYRDPIEVADLVIGGDDLKDIGIKGPAVGRVLRKLLENVINDPAVNTRERLLALAADET
jgi:hypothetical protein